MFRREPTRLRTSNKEQNRVRASESWDLTLISGAQERLLSFEKASDLREERLARERERKNQECILPKRGEDTDS